jgi:tetratricopeptide (TPR) repeat protein
MTGRLVRSTIVTTLAALLATPFVPSAVQGQGQEVTGRFRVIVPILERRDEQSDKNFGKDVSKEFRELLNDLATHQPVEENEVKDAAKRFKLDYDKLTCIQVRQLASQINAQLVTCGGYEQVGTEYSVDATFISVANGESFEVEPFTVPEKDKTSAASAIFESFDLLVQQTRYAAFCGDYATSQQWDNALTNCDRAIELSPGSVSSRYTRARVLMELDRMDEAYTELEEVLALNPIHEDALQTAGFVAIQLGDIEASRAHYNSYLEMNPGNAQVRMHVAYELAQEGDPAGAMMMIEEGLALEPDNIELSKQHGNFAFAAAQQAMGDQPATEDAELPAEVVELYNKALASYEVVYAAEGAEMNASQLRSMVAAQMQLNRLDEALELAARALETHPEEGALWSIYADALGRAGRIDDAIDALDELKGIDPEYPNLAVRQGRWLLDEGRVDEALPRLKEAAERGEQPVDVVAGLVFSRGYSEGVQKNDFLYAQRMFEAAKTFEVSERMKAQLDFWHGFALYNRGRIAQEAQTLETAQQTLPLFQQAQALFRAGASYANEQPSINLQQFLDATSTYIEIQDAIIKRGR